MDITRRLIGISPIHSADNKEVVDVDVSGLIRRRTESRHKTDYGALRRHARKYTGARDKNSDEGKTNSSGQGSDAAQAKMDNGLGIEERAKLTVQRGKKVVEIA
jgi:hypothetical protein